jgi:hypothetical protein
MAKEGSTIAINSYTKATGKTGIATAMEEVIMKTGNSSTKASGKMENAMVKEECSVSMENFNTKGSGLAELFTQAN